jgi:SAM-dependent methyltransferase
MRSDTEPAVTAEPLLHMAVDFYRWRTVQFALELDLFTQLTGVPHTEAQVRDRFGLADRGARDFLDALVAVGLLDRDGETYEATSLASEFLDRGTPSYLGRFLAIADARWAEVGPALRTGEPQNGAQAGASMFTEQHRDIAAWTAYYGGMDALNGPNGAALAHAFDWSTVRDVVDAGGARGNVALHLVRANPHLAATVFDLPAVREVFEAHMAAHGVTDEVRFRPGNFFQDRLPATDAVVFGHVLHDWGVAERKVLARKAYEALRPGGVALVYDTMIDDDRRDATSLLVSLNMMICTPRGSEYTTAECGSWFTDAGFDRIETRFLTSDDTLLVAYKAGGASAQEGVG